MVGAAPQVAGDRVDRLEQDRLSRDRLGVVQSIELLSASGWSDVAGSESALVIGEAVVAPDRPRRERARQAEARAGGAPAHRRDPPAPVPVGGHGTAPVVAAHSVPSWPAMPHRSRRRRTVAVPGPILSA